MSLSFIKRAEQGNRSALSFVATICICIGALIAGQSLPLMLAILIKRSINGQGMVGQGEIDTMEEIMSFFPYHISFSLLMMGFVFLIFALWFSVKFIHKRKFGTLWSDQDRFRGKNFWLGIFISLILFVVSDLVIHAMDPGYHTWVFDPKKFWIYLPFALLLIPLQTLSEELFFRGYLYQTAGLLSKNKWMALIISASVFGLFHFGNTEMSMGFWKMGIIYIGSGVMIGLSVMISKGIEFGWGFHLVNNLYLSTISTFPGSSLNGPTLFTIPKPSGDRILMEFGVQFLLFALILVVVYRRNVKSLFDPTA
jgi:membrane protease YdiL (CAAX protease family)